MKFAEINRKYTETVAEWMAKGYTINTATMNGSQGELAKIDLTDGHELIRILLDNFGKPIERIGNRCYRLDGLTLIVGRVTDRVIPNSPDTWQNVWNEHLETISCEVFYEIGRQHRDGSKWYGTKDAAIAQQNKEFERYYARNEKTKQELSEAAREIVLPFIRRQNRCKSVRLSEIDAVTKHYSKSRTGRVSVQYTISVRGTNYTLH